MHTTFANTYTFADTNTSIQSHVAKKICRHIHTLAYINFSHTCECLRRPTYTGTNADTEIYMHKRTRPQKRKHTIYNTSTNFYTLEHIYARTCKASIYAQPQLHTDIVQPTQTVLYFERQNREHQCREREYSYVLLMFMLVQTCPCLYTLMCAHAYHLTHTHTQ